MTTSRSKLLPKLKELFNDCWISIADDPPREDDGIIFVYNPKINQVSTMPADILLSQLRQTQTKELLDNWKGNKDPYLYHTGYYVSHWMPAIVPGMPIDVIQDINEQAIRHCSVCGQRQHPTKSGWVCANGHGGVESLEDSPDEEIIPKQKKKPKSRRTRYPGGGAGRKDNHQVGKDGGKHKKGVRTKWDRSRKKKLSKVPKKKDRPVRGMFI